MKMTSKRNPYPYPRLEGDLQFAGHDGADCSRNNKQITMCPDLTNSNPWERLNLTKTQSKLLKESIDNGRMNDLYRACNGGGSSPGHLVDSLDFSLQSEYDHHKEFLKGKNETCLQKQTLNVTECVSPSNGTSTRNPNVKRLAPKHPLRLVGSANKRSQHSIKTVISSHHTQTTNNGFARKPDGGFYSS